MYITYMYYKKDQKNNKKIDTHDIHQYTYIYYYIVVSYIIYVIMYYSCTCIWPYTVPHCRCVKM